MISHHIIYDITWIVFMTSPPLYLKWHPPYLCHHNNSIDGLRPTLCMTSHPLYVCQLMHSTQRHIQSLWLQTIVVITLHPLHSWHHTPYIWHHTHGNANVISAIWRAIFNTTLTVSVIKNTVSIIAQLLSVWYHIDYMCDILYSMHAIKTTVYDIIPLCV